MRGLGIGDWGLGPIPNPQSPIPNPLLVNLILFLNILNNFNIYYYLILIFKYIIKSNIIYLFIQFSNYNNSKKGNYILNKNYTYN